MSRRIHGLLLAGALLACRGEGRPEPARDRTPPVAPDERTEAPAEPSLPAQAGSILEARLRGASARLTVGGCDAVSATLQRAGGVWRTPDRGLVHVRRTRDGRVRGIGFDPSPDVWQYELPKALADQPVVFDELCLRGDRLSFRVSGSGAGGEFIGTAGAPAGQTIAGTLGGAPYRLERFVPVDAPPCCEALSLYCEDQREPEERQRCYVAQEQARVRCRLRQLVYRSYEELARYQRAQASGRQAWKVPVIELFVGGSAMGVTRQVDETTKEAAVAMVESQTAIEGRVVWDFRRARVMDQSHEDFWQAMHVFALGRGYWKHGGEIVSTRYHVLGDAYLAGEFRDMADTCTSDLEIGAHDPQLLGMLAAYLRFGPVPELAEEHALASSLQGVALNPNASLKDKALAGMFLGAMVGSRVLDLAGLKGQARSFRLMFRRNAKVLEDRIARLQMRLAQPDLPADTRDEIEALLEREREALATQKLMADQYDEIVKALDRGSSRPVYEAYLGTKNNDELRAMLRQADGPSLTRTLASEELGERAAEHFVKRRFPGVERPPEANGVLHGPDQVYRSTDGNKDIFIEAKSRSGALREQDPLAATLADNRRANAQQHTPPDLREYARREADRMREQLRQLARQRAAAGSPEELALLAEAEAHITRRRELWSRISRKGVNADNAEIYVVVTDPLEQGYRVWRWDFGAANGRGGWVEDVPGAGRLP